MRRWPRVLPAALLLLPVAGSAQDVATNPWPADEAALIAIARSAAPPEVSANADVWVLRDGRFVRAVEGTGDTACLVTKDHPDSMYPICYDAAGARTVLPIQIREHELRTRGLSDDAVWAEIGAAVARGELRPPERGAVAYMMSPSQVIYATPEGPRVGTWHPHIMLYLPYTTAAEAGTERVPGFSFLVRPGTLTTHLVVIVNDWAKPPA